MGLVQSLRLQLDAGARSKLVADFRAAGAESTAALQNELKRKQGELRAALAGGLISKEEYARRGKEAAEAYNAAVLERIQALKTAGSLTNAEYVKLTKSLQLAGKTGGESASLLSKAWTGFKNVIVNLAPTLLAALSVRAAYNFAKESIKAAMDSQKAFASIAASVESIGIKWDDVKDQVIAATDEILAHSRFDDEAAARSFQILLDKTQDYATSLKNLGFVADYAAAKNITMEEAAEVLGKAMAGNTLALEKANPLYKGHADIIELLRAHYKGFAEKDLATFDGALKHLGNLWDNLKETLGFLFIDAQNGATIMQLLGATIVDLTTWVVKNKDEIRRWVEWGIKAAISETKNFVATTKTIFGAISATSDAVGAFGRGIANVFNRVDIAVATAGQKILAVFLKLTTAAARAADALGLKGVAADLREAASGISAVIGNLGTTIARDTAAMANRLGADDPTATKTTSLGGGMAANTKAGTEKSAAALAALAEKARIAAEKAAAAHEKAAKKTAEMWKAALTDSLDGFKRYGDSIEGLTKEQLGTLDAMQREFDRKRFQAVLDGIAKTDKVVRSGEEATRAAIVKSGTVHVETNQTVTDSAEDAATASRNAWINSLNLVQSSLQGLGKVAGGIFGGLIDSLSGIASGMTAVLGGLNSITEAQKQKGLKGTIGQIAGAAGVVGGAIGVASTIIGAIGGLFHRDKDPDRLATNRQWFLAAVQNTDQAALDSLYRMSGRLTKDGWATDNARNDAYDAYLEALRLNVSLHPSGTNTVNLRHRGGMLEHELSDPVRLVDPAVFAGARRVHRGGLLAGEVPFIGQTGEGVLTRSAMGLLGTAWLNAMNGPRTAPAALQAMNGGSVDNRTLNVVVNLQGIADRDVPRRVVDEISMRLGQNFQKHAALQGNVQLPE